MLKGWSGAAALGQDIAVVRKFPAAVPKGVQAGTVLRRISNALGSAQVSDVNTDKSADKIS
jgi:hypothetical protein